MGIPNSICSIRSKNYIDVYLVNSKAKLIHYYVNPQTNWKIKSEVIYDGAMGNVAVIRHLDFIDIYFINTRYQLIHMWANAQFTKWKYKTQTLLSGANLLIGPVAFRFSDYIDVYCVNYVNGHQNLIHLSANNETKWKYKSQIIKKCSGKILGLTGIRTSSNSMDIFFNQGEALWNGHAIAHNKWVHEFKKLSTKPTNKSKLVSLKKDKNMDLFFCNNQNYIRQLSSSDGKNWDYESSQYLKNCRALDSQFQVIRFQDHIDLYFIGYDYHIHHTYSGSLSNWKWTKPQKISSIAATRDFGLTVCRKKNAIDVFYVSGKQELQNLYIGQGTNNDWSRYWTKGKETCQCFSNTKKVLKWQQIKNQCKRIGDEGYHALAYYCKRLNLVLKIMKRPNANIISKQIALLNKLESIWPNLCQYQVVNKGILVGFSVKYAKGVKWTQIMKDPENIFINSPKARVALFVKIKKMVAKIQKLNICHGDLSFDNILIDIKSKSKCQFDVSILDFGNGFCFKQNCQVTEVLTGWQFLKPYESRSKKPYNPSGVNAFQVGRIGLIILLACQFKSHNQIQLNPYNELEKLKNKNVFYSQELINMVQNLCHPTDLNIRNNNLFANPQNLLVKPAHIQAMQNLQKFQKIQGIYISVGNAPLYDSDGGQTIDWFIQSVLLFTQISNPVLGIALDRVYAIFKIWTQQDPFEQMKRKIENLIDQKISQFASQKAKSTLKTISILTHEGFEQLKNDKISRTTRKAKYIALDTTIQASLSDMRISGYEMLLIPEFIAVSILHMKLIQLGIMHSEKFKWNQEEKLLNINKLKNKYAQYTNHYSYSVQKHKDKFDNRLKELSVLEQQQKRKMPTRVGFPGLEKVRYAMKLIQDQKSQFISNAVSKFSAVVDGYQKMLQF